MARVLALFRSRAERERTASQAEGATHDLDQYLHTCTSQPVFTNLLRRYFSVPDIFRKRSSAIAELRHAGLTFDNMSLDERQTRSSTTRVHRTVPSSTRNLETAPPKKKQKLDPSIICRFCADKVDITATEAWSRPCRSCRDVVCHECLKRQFKSGQTDTSLLPLRCCESAYHPDVFRGLVSREALEQYKTRLDERQTTAPFYCAVSTCSELIPARLLKPIDGKIKCPKCSAQTCFLCREISLEGHICVENPEHKKITGVYKYKKCPRCATAVMKMYGCSHIRCLCGAQWCWDCRRPKKVCDRHPCQRAREEGEEYYEDDESASDVDDDDSTINLNTSGNASRQSNVEPAPNSFNGAVRSTQAESEPGLENITQANGEVAASSTHSHDNATNSLTVEAGSGQATTALAPEEPNLDDPDGETHWEDEGYDFGDEPAIELHDAWGCQHRYTKLTLATLHDHWLLKDHSNRHGITLDCTGCFMPMQITDLVVGFNPTNPRSVPSRPVPIPQTTLSRENATLAIGSNSNTDASQAAAPALDPNDISSQTLDTVELPIIAAFEQKVRTLRGVPPDQQAKVEQEQEESVRGRMEAENKALEEASRVAREKQRRQWKKVQRAGVYECNECGAVHCYQCWKEAKKRMRDWKTEGAGVNE